MIGCSAYQEASKCSCLSSSLWGEKKHTLLVVLPKGPHLQWHPPTHGKELRPRTTRQQHVNKHPLQTTANFSLLRCSFSPSRILSHLPPNAPKAFAKLHGRARALLWPSPTRESFTSAPLAPTEGTTTMAPAPWDSVPPADQHFVLITGANRCTHPGPQPPTNHSTS